MKVLFLSILGTLLSCFTGPSNVLHAQSKLEDISVAFNLAEIEWEDRNQLMDSVKYYANNDFDKSISFGLKLLTTLDNNALRREFLDAYYYVEIQLARGKYKDLTSRFLEFCQSQSREHGLPRLEALSLTKMGGNSYSQSNSEDASKYLYQSLDIYKTHPDVHEIKAHLLLSLINSEKGLYLEAQKHLAYADKIAATYPDNLYMGYYFLCKSFSWYLSTGDIPRPEENVDSALYYVDLAYPHLQKNRNYVMLSHYFSQRISILVYQGKDELARSFIEKGRQYLSEKYPTGICFFHLTAIDYYLHPKINAPEKAYQHLEEGKKIVEKYQLDFYEYLLSRKGVRIYSRLKGDEEIWALFQHTDSLKERINDNKIKETISQYEVKYNTQVLRNNNIFAQQELEAESKKSQFLFFICILILVLSLVLAKLFLQKKKYNQILNQSNIRLSDQNKVLNEQSIKLLELNQQLNASQISLEKSNKKLESFGHKVSHDLREPIRSMTSFARILERRYQGVLDCEAKEYLNYIIQGGRNASNLVIEILGSAKLKTKLTAYEVDLDEVLQLAKSNLFREIQGSSAQINCSDTLGSIWGLKSEMLQLFVNLISNSIKYRRDESKPQINISSKREDNWLYLWFEDNGKGLNVEDGTIFDLFVKNNSDDNSFGIGLNTCKEIVREYDGNIQVKSQLGVGATFIVKLSLHRLPINAIEKQESKKIV